MQVFEFPNRYPFNKSLRALLGYHLNQQPNQVAILRTKTGKPWHPNIHFNLSHCRERALIAIDLTRPVGIDLEAHRPVHNMPQIIERFFPGTKPEDFFDCWTAHEALVKAQGLGLLGKPERDGWALRKLDIGPNWSAHLAFQGAQDPLEIVHVQDFPMELLDC